MTWNTAYLALNLLVTPAWVLLICFPRALLTAHLVHSSIYPLGFGLIYTASLVAGAVFGMSADGVGFTSIEAVAVLFDHPNGVITGWTHYLVFDLFVGAWIGRDARRHHLHHLIVVPCLLGTYVFGPFGLLLYVLLRGLQARTGLRLDEG